MSAPRRPVSPKVWSAAGAAGVVAQFILWLLNSFVFDGDIYDTGYAAVPYAVSALVTFAVAFGAGYLPADEASALFAAQNQPTPPALGAGAMGTGEALAADELDDTAVTPAPTSDEASEWDPAEHPRDDDGQLVAKA